MGSRNTLTDELVDSEQLAAIGDGETRFGEHLAGGLLEGHLVAVERDESSIGDDLDEASSPGPERIRDTVPAEDHEREERAVLGLDLELLEFREC